MNIPTSLIETVYGRMIVLDTDINQTRSLKSGRIKDELALRRLSAKIEKIEKPVFLDVGGCMGVYTIALSPLVEERGGRTYCFEAQRILANCISGSIALNGFERAYCINKAVGNPMVGQESLINYGWNAKHFIDVPKFDYKKPLNFGSVEFSKEQKEKLGQDRNYESKPEKVELVSLDSCINEFGKVDVIKMDIEGMEEEAMKGAKKIIKRFHPLVYIEHIKSDKEKLQDFFREMGYGRYDCPARDRGNLWCEKA
tara:strand:- start:1849 stop:2613 length:765 start_codon:yes stop_codon:yes gene_type:complete